MSRVLRQSQKLNITGGKGRAVVKRNDNNTGPRKISKGRTKPSSTVMSRPGPVNTQAATTEDCQLMETSELRDADNISDINLSQVINVQEYEDVELAKTEMELGRMGEVPSCGRDGYHAQWWAGVNLYTKRYLLPLINALLSLGEQRTM